MEAALVTKGPKDAWSRRSFDKIISKKRWAEIHKFLEQSFRLNQIDEQPQTPPPVRLDKLKAPKP
jgi:hypothetical protein